MPAKRKAAKDAEPAAAETVEPASKVLKKAESNAAAATSKAAGGKLALGQAIPNVTLLNQDELEVSLHELVKDRGAIIFMYPRANTGGCTKQALGLKEHHEDIQALGYEIFGMSFDKPKSQTNWKNKYSLPYDLLTDADGQLIKAFGALKGQNKVNRSHVVIGKGGKLLSVRNNIKPGDSFAQAFAFCKEHPQN